MGDRSAIEWTEATWNPTTGCSKVSPGCAHCYAEAVSLRFKRSAGPWTPANAAENVVLHPERLEQPLRWRRPRMIFVDSMSDLFHEQIPDDYIAQVFAVMGNATHHTFQVLTKRPERMQALLGDSTFWWTVYRMAQNDPVPPVVSVRVNYSLPNVWLGVSIENRRFVDRARILGETPAAVRFISAEPLLGPLVAEEHSVSWDPDHETVENWEWPDDYRGPDLRWYNESGELAFHWLIAGGESGRGARTMHADWVRALRDTCVHEGVAFFFKQWGGVRPGGDALLDGREWREFPAVPA